MKKRVTLVEVITAPITTADEKHNVSHMANVHRSSYFLCIFMFESTIFVYNKTHHLVSAEVILLQ